MTIKERLIKFAKSKERSVRAFEREAGLTIGYVNTIRVSVQPDKLQRIASRYPDLNAEWLMTGVGPMTRGGSVNTPAAANKAETPDVFTAPLLPLAAQGGTLNDFVVSIKVAECERVVTPIRDVDFVMTVTGDSMAPDYPNGAHRFGLFASVGDKIEFESHVILFRLLDVVDYLPDGHNVGRSSEPSDDGAPVVDDSFRLVDYALVFEFERARHLMRGDVHIRRQLQCLPSMGYSYLYVVGSVLPFIVGVDNGFECGRHGAAF